MFRVLSLLALLLCSPALAAVPDAPPPPAGTAQAVAGTPLPERAGPLARPADRANLGTVRDLRGGRRLYRLGNGIAFTGIGLAATGAGLWGWIAATCADPHHGCAFAYLGVATVTFLPAAVLLPGGTLLSTAGLGRMDVGVNRIAHRVFLAGLATSGAGFLLNAAAPSTVGTALALGGAGVALLASTTQLVVNLATPKRPRAGALAVLPAVAGDAPGLVLAGRF